MTEVISTTARIQAKKLTRPLDHAVLKMGLLKQPSSLLKERCKFEFNKA